VPARENVLVAVSPVVTSGNVPSYINQLTVAQESATSVPSATKTAVKQLVLTPTFMRVADWAWAEFPRRNIKAKVKNCIDFFMSCFSNTKLDLLCLSFVVRWFVVC
jgi:hypothetical protein